MRLGMGLGRRNKWGSEMKDAVVVLVFLVLFVAFFAGIFWVMNHGPCWLPASKLSASRVAECMVR